MGETALAPRCAALVGTYLSGKTTLLESMLFAVGATNRKGSTKEGNTVGDSSQEARERHMSVEVSVASCQYLDDDWTLLDCPGSIEFGQDPINAVAVADVAIVVCEPDPGKAQGLAPLFKFLADHDVPHMVFINKIDNPTARVSEVLEALQAVSQKPLLLRQVPIRNDEAMTGYVDVISERAYAYKEGEPSALIQLPDAVKEDEQQARQELLEALADFDDTLLEQLLEDVVPDTADIYARLQASVADDDVVPVLLGSGETQSGVKRLWKALRHDVPAAGQTAARWGHSGDDLAIRVFKTYHAPHAGKLSIGRVWTGSVAEGQTLGDLRVSGLYRLVGLNQEKIDQAGPGSVVALGRMDPVQTGDLITAGSRQEAAAGWPAPLAPVYSFAISADKREDEVKLSAAVQKLVEEDPSYRMEVNADTHEMVLWGQGEIHLAVGIDRLRNKYKVGVSGRRPQVAYKETIRKPVDQHARHKKQSGGHGQFGDVKVEIKPLPRGQGFEFSDRVVGGSVPRQYIPSVEAGVREYLKRGPLGFPIVDVAVCLYDGQYHSVDSSDMAFRTAAALAMREGMPQAGPVLLEPIFKVRVNVPTDHASKATNLVSGRRGQILGMGALEGWSGWDTVDAYMPQAELHDLIIELRSATQGAGGFEFEFDHLSELTGKQADDVVARRKEALEAA